MRKLHFYTTKSGSSPVEDYLNSLSDKHAKKVAWVLRLVRDLDFITKTYFKKLINTNDIWEVRIKSGSSSFRILCFFYKGNIIILTNGFAKKTQKTKIKEIKLSERRKKEYLERRK